MALNDPYFIEKKLFPNVDFYSGVILSAIGFPTTMFTALFALARTVGWGCAMERDDFGPRTEDRTAAPALYRARRTQLCAGRQALGRFRKWQRKHEARTLAAGRAVQGYIAAPWHVQAGVK